MDQPNATFPIFTLNGKLLFTPPAPISKRDFLIVVAGIISLIWLPLVYAVVATVLLLIVSQYFKPKPGPPKVYFNVSLCHDLLMGYFIEIRGEKVFLFNKPIRGEYYYIQSTGKGKSGWTCFIHYKCAKQKQFILCANYETLPDEFKSGTSMYSIPNYWSDEFVLEVDSFGLTLFMQKTQEYMK